MGFRLRKTGHATCFGSHKMRVWCACVQPQRRIYSFSVSYQCSNHRGHSGSKPVASAVLEFSTHSSHTHTQSEFGRIDTTCARADAGSSSRVACRVCVCDSHRRLFIMLLLMTASTHTRNRAHAAESATSVATAIIIIIISQIHITMQAHKRPLAAHEVKPTQDQFIVAVNMKTEKKQKYCLLLLRQRRKAKLFWNVFFFSYFIFASFAPYSLLKLPMRGQQHRSILQSFRVCAQQWTNATAAAAAVVGFECMTKFVHGFCLFFDRCSASAVQREHNFRWNG